MEASRERSENLFVQVKDDPDQDRDDHIQPQDDDVRLSNGLLQYLLNKDTEAEELRKQYRALQKTSTTLLEGLEV